MNFNNILASVEYSIIERTEIYLHIQLSSSQYLFYNGNGLRCFDISNFKEIGIVDFFEKNFPLTNLEIIAVTNQSGNVDLNFKPSDLSTVLGLSFKLYKFDKITKDQLIHEPAFEFIELIDFILPSTSWRYSIETNQFFIIPNKTTFLQFNSNSYKHFGESFKLKTGSITYGFLNPFTLMDYFSTALPNQSDEIIIGPIKKGILVIRSTEQELKKAIRLSVSIMGGIVIEERDHITIRIDVPFIELDGIQNKMINLFKASINEFETLTGYKYQTEKKLFIKPKPRIQVSKKPSTEIIFGHSIHMMQLVIKHILNPHNKELQIDNVSYNEPSYFEEMKDEPNDLGNVPDEVLNEYFN